MGFHPDLITIGRRHPPFDDEALFAPLEDTLVVFAQLGRRITPRQFDVELADDGATGADADVFGEAAIAAQVAALGVFPEHPQRQGIEHGLKQLTRLAQTRLGVLERGDVDMGADHTGGATVAVAFDDATAR